MDPTRRSFLIGAGASTLSPVLSEAATASKMVEPLRSFKPGQVWHDTSGKPIFVHGGSIIESGGIFYWYGENKEHTLGNTGVWHWGVRCYSSSNLYDWDDMGVIIPPKPDDPDSPLNPSRFMDRPHILFNQHTKKYVCWVKLMEKNGDQTRTVLTADALTGPYTLLRSGIRPLGMNAGDFDLVVSPDDGKGYMYFERVHTELICADLTDDYTDFSGYYSTHFPRVRPPFVREAPAHFFRDGKHYLATSGTTGYYPNPSEIAVADTFHGPWTTLGDLHPGDRSRTSFNSQISSIFKHPSKRDLYIALADRWLPDLSGPTFDNGQDSRDVQSAFSKRFSRPPQPLTPREQSIMTATADSRANTSLSRQVWLPIKFTASRPIIEWRDSWSLDEFA